MPISCRVVLRARSRAQIIRCARLARAHMFCRSDGHMARVYARALSRAKTGTILCMGLSSSSAAAAPNNARTQTHSQPHTKNPNQPSSSSSQPLMLQRAAAISPAFGAHANQSDFLWCDRFAKSASRAWWAKDAAEGPTKEGEVVRLSLSRCWVACNSHAHREILGRCLRTAKHAAHRHGHGRVCTTHVGVRARARVLSFHSSSWRAHACAVKNLMNQIIGAGVSCTCTQTHMMARGVRASSGRAARIVL